MSYDLQVWSLDRPPLPEALQDPGAWALASGTWTHGRRGWQISVNVAEVLPEDIPEGVRFSLPGIRFLTEFNLSPFHAPNTARASLMRAAKGVAKLAHGVVFDPQGALLLSRSAEPKEEARSIQTLELLHLELAFFDGPFMRRDFRGLFDLLGRSFPEAIPKRYGLSEPLQYRLAETGMEHFLKLIAENEHAFCDARPPVSVLSFFAPFEQYPFHGFRSGQLSLSFERDLLRARGGNTRFQRLWKEISLMACAFYGRVAVSRGFRRRGQYHQTAEEFRAGRKTTHGNQFGWWRGIPAVESLAVVLGPPYLELWPAFRARCERAGSLGFVSADDWTQDGNALAAIGSPPLELAEPPRQPNGDAPYPPVWPFERVRD